MYKTITQYIFFFFVRRYTLRTTLKPLPSVLDNASPITNSDYPQVHLHIWQPALSWSSTSGLKISPFELFFWCFCRFLPMYMPQPSYLLNFMNLIISQYLIESYNSELILFAITYLVLGPVKNQQANTIIIIRKIVNV